MMIIDRIHLTHNQYQSPRLQSAKLHKSLCTNAQFFMHFKKRNLIKSNQSKSTNCQRAKYAADLKASSSYQPIMICRLLKKNHETRPAVPDEGQKNIIWTSIARPVSSPALCCLLKKGSWKVENAAVGHGLLARRLPPATPAVEYRCH